MTTTPLEITWDMPSLELLSPAKFLRAIRDLRFRHHVLIVLSTMVPAFTLFAMDAYYGLPVKGLTWFIGLVAGCYISFFVLLYLALALSSWLLPIMVRLAPGKGSLMLRKINPFRARSAPEHFEPVHFSFSAAHVVYADLRNPERPYLLFSPAVLPKPIPIHPQITIDLLRSTVFQQNPLRVIGPSRYADRRRIPVWTAQTDETAFPAAIALYFHRGVEPEYCHSAAAALANLPQGILLGNALELPDLGVIQFLAAPALQAERRHTVKDIVELLLNRLEQERPLARSVAGILLEEAADETPPPLPMVRHTSFLARLTIRLFSPTQAISFSQERARGGG